MPNHNWWKNMFLTRQRGKGGKYLTRQRGRGGKYLTRQRGRDVSNPAAGGGEGNI